MNSSSSRAVLLTAALALIAMMPVRAQQVTISQNGSTTTINQGSAVASSAAGIVINENKTVKTYTLTNSPLVLNGNNNVIRIAGTCTRLAVNGNNNTVEVETAQQIGVAGNRNTVGWLKGTPQVSNTGNGNVVGKR